MYDLIVLGVGGIGSSVVYQAAVRGLSVLGLESFEAGHDRGSSHGESRVIRMAYFEHPDYVPLLRRAYQLWDELQRESQRELFVRCGLIESGPETGLVVPGVLQSAEQHGLPIEQLTVGEAARRFPMFQFSKDSEIVLETNAGFLLVERCVKSQIQLAAERGASCLFQSKVLDWTSDASGVTVRTASDRFRARRMIITAGPWASSWTRSSAFTLELRVLRKFLHWYRANADVWKHAPCYFFEQPDRSFFYGFPCLDGESIKLAEHSGGELVDAICQSPVQFDPEDIARVDQFRAATLLDVSSHVLKRSSCYYTMSPDENFIVDFHPDDARIVYAAGLSGHGFKFTPVLAEILLDLATDGETGHSIDFLRSRRLS